MHLRDQCSLLPPWSWGDQTEEQLVEAPGAICTSQSAPTCYFRVGMGSELVLDLYIVPHTLSWATGWSCVDVPPGSARSTMTTNCQWVCRLPITGQLALVWILDWIFDDLYSQSPESQLLEAVLCDWVFASLCGNIGRILSSHGMSVVSCEGDPRPRYKSSPF